MPLPEPPESAWSLRTRLLLALAALLAGLLVAGTAMMYRLAQEASGRLYDDSLRQTAELLAQLATHEVEEHGPSLGETLLHLETQTGPFQLHYQIWTSDQRRAYRTQGAPEQPYLPFGMLGYGWTQVKGEAWRAYSMIGPGGQLNLQIAESLRYRSHLPESILLRMGGAMLAMLLLGVPLIAWILHRAFAGVQRVALDVAHRAGTDLSPVDAATLPREVQPLLAALNRQLDKLRGVLENERRFTSDAAHELRTPLAAIRLNAQLLRNAGDAARVGDIGNDLLAGVDRSTRLVEQLLALARLDASTQKVQQFAPLELSTVIASQLPEQERSAHRRGTSIVVQADEACVRGDLELLAVLLRNLLDNAIRHGGPEGRVTVGCGEHAAGPRLWVCDTGPGVPEAERERIFERFHRVEGTSEFGSGLGLSIVRRIAELHGARLEVGTGPDGRGACFTVHFPPAAAATA